MLLRVSAGFSSPAQTRQPLGSAGGSVIPLLLGPCLLSFLPLCNLRAFPLGTVHNKRILIRTWLSNIRKNYHCGRGGGCTRAVWADPFRSDSKRDFGNRKSKIENRDREAVLEPGSTMAGYSEWFERARGRACVHIARKLTRADLKLLTNALTPRGSHTPLPARAVLVHGDVRVQRGSVGTRSGKMTSRWRWLLERNPPQQARKNVRYRY